MNAYRRRKVAKAGCFSCMIAVLLAGCSAGHEDDLTTYVRDIKARKQAKIEPIPVVQHPAPFLYSEQGRLDPFLPFSAAPIIQIPQAGNAQPDLQRRKEPLEEFPLDSLVIAGVMEVRGERWAIIRTAEGMVHRVKRGNYLGQNSGRVVKVGDEKLEIVEVLSDGFGGWVERPASLTLAK